VSAPEETRSALAWGGGSEMNALEALMWRAEADPRLRSTIFALELLDEVPDWERLVAAHDWGTRMVPRFRQRVVEPALWLGAPSWAVDPDFDLNYHVRRLRLPGGGSWRDLLTIVSQIAMTPFDRARSPWEAVLIEGLADGKAAYLLKMHHATTDGMGGIQLLAGIHSRTREPDLDKPQPPPPVGERVTSAGTLARQVARDARGAARMLRRSSGALRALARPDQAARDALGYASSLRRVLAGPPAEGSPLLGARSMSWRLSALDVAFADLRAAGKAAGGSLNDAYLAALLGAFRRYHEQLGQPVSTLPMAVPISLRRSEDSEGGNRFAGARLAGPMDIADPGERIAAIGALVRAARDELAVDGVALVAPALSRLPGSVISRLAGGMTKANDLQASNVPGLRQDAYLAGALVERLYGFGPLPGCACMAALVTHRDTCCVAVNSDPAAITEGELFGRCLVEGFAEVLTLHPNATPPLLRA